MAGCGAMDQCGISGCCAIGHCCGGSCCADSGMHCCGSVCCESESCCSADRDACGIVVGGASDNSTLSAMCTSTAKALANQTITIPIVIGGTSSTAWITGSSSIPFSPASVTDSLPGNSSGAKSNSGALSDSAIAGVVVGGVVVVLRQVAVIWLYRCRKKSDQSTKPEKCQPLGGRHELVSDKVDLSKNRTEIEGSQIHEKEVPPHEISDGPLSPIRELPVVTKPGELDGSGTSVTATQGVRDED